MTSSRHDIAGKTVAVSGAGNVAIYAVEKAEQLGAKVVKVVCLLELKGLHGRERIKTCPAETVVAYEGK